MNIHTRAFSAPYNVQARALISSVRICPPIPEPSIIKKEIEIEDYTTSEFQAIWDTGATGTVITQRVADTCGLQPIGRTKVHTVGGEKESLVYLASVFLPNKIGISPITVTVGELGGDCDVLIGMDIISRGDFAVTNKDGNTLFSFRMPSTERIDFEKNS